MVLSINEKTAIAARPRKHPTTPTRPGRAARRELEHRRHGTVSLMAALDVHNGEVLGRIIERNDSTAFISFLFLSVPFCPRSTRRSTPAPTFI